MVGGRAGPAETRTVVSVCHRLAEAYLRTTYVTNRSLAGLTLEDQAMDAIADLFERSGPRFPVLEAYVTESEETIRAMSRDEMVERLRPLVHGVVTDRIFESNGEVDASLSRLIRSVKRAVKQAPKSDVKRSMNTLHVTVAPKKKEAGNLELQSVTGRSRPTISVERLAARLAPAVRSGAQVPDLVSVAIDFLASHVHYAPSVPVTALALAIRAAAVEVELSTAAPGCIGSESTTLSRAFSRLVTSDIERLIDETVTHIQDQKRAHYVERKNIAEELYSSYFSAIRSYLEARYLPPADAALTQHEALRLHRPDITRKVYREHHRSAFEYLVRTVREAFIETLQRVHADLTDRSFL